MEKKPRQWPPEGHRFFGSLEDEIKRANDELAWQLFIQEIQSDEAFANLVSTYPPGALDVSVVLETEPAASSAPPPENAPTEAGTSPAKRGPRKGEVARYADNDVKWCPEIHRRIVELKESKTAAALTVATENFDQIGGENTTPESKAKRLLIVYRLWLNSQR